MKIYAPLLAALCGLSSPVFAQTAEGPIQMEDEAIAYVGAIGLLSSKYLGSADEELRPLPYLSVDNLKGFDLFGTSLSYRAVEIGTGQGLDKWSLRAGPSLTFQGGRDSDDSETLTGLEDIGSSVLAGGYVRGTIGPVGLRFSAAQDIIGGHDGLTADASIGTFLPLGPLKILPSASVSWGSGGHNQSFFGITEAQSEASGLNVNNVDSGIYAYSVNVVSWLELDENYIISLIGTHRWFTEEANDSPIILAEDGADTGIFVALGIARKFTL
jgi:outer membrane scaffolding protein for murein synthesis (MipA/OmpV family)